MNVHQCKASKPLVRQCIPKVGFQQLQCTEGSFGCTGRHRQCTIYSQQILDVFVALWYDVQCFQWQFRSVLQRYTDAESLPLKKFIANFFLWRKIGMARFVIQNASATSFQWYCSITEGTRATSFNTVNWCVENFSFIAVIMESRYGYQMARR